ncbi:MAG TPA: hypothetical protein VMM36_19595 [Opitutaceae bacterium]|nr:hypothetical protein [Opitutaceae bacterium]
MKISVRGTVRVGLVLLVALRVSAGTDQLSRAESRRSRGGPRGV